MVKLRLLRVGRHKLASFRIVVSDSKSKANGAYIENLGHYDPVQEKNTTLKEFEIIKWLAYGAQPTETVRSLLSKNGIWSKFISLKEKKELEKYLNIKPVKKEEPKKTKPKTEKPKVEKQVKKEEPKIEVKKEEEPKQEPVKKEEPKVKEEKLAIKKDSKLVNKYSEEEIAKRESQVFTVADESEIEGDSPKTIMISLDKKYVENILNDEKEIVFLKRLPIQEVNRVLIYVVKPIGRVVGEFDLKSTQTLSKTKAWKDFGSRSIFAKKEFDKYFESSTDVKLMEISGFIQYRNPKELKQYKLSKGPSGFTYLK